MKPKSPLWRITHYPAGAAASTEYTVRAPNHRRALTTLSRFLEVPQWTLRPVRHPVG